MGFVDTVTQHMKEILLLLFAFAVAEELNSKDTMCLACQAIVPTFRKHSVIEEEDLNTSRRLVCTKFKKFGISGVQHLRSFLDYEGIQKASKDWKPINLVKFDEKELEKFCVEILNQETMEKIKELAHQGVSGAGLYMK